MWLKFLLVVFLAARAFCADLLVQGAMDSELEPLLEALHGKKEIHIAAWTFWTGKIGQKSVVVSRTEVGPINAAAATALAIERFAPRAIVSQGTAGANNPDLKVYDIVVSEKVTDYSGFRSPHADVGQGSDPARWTPLYHGLRLDNQSVTRFRTFPADPALAASALAAKYTKGKLVKGNIGSALEYNREMDRLVWLRKTYGIDSEDMESASAAGVAVAMKTPFVAVRIISDSEWTHPTFEKIAGQYCAEFVRDWVQSMR